jgi:ribosomal protein L40E
MPDAQGSTDQIKLEEKAKRILASPKDETKTAQEVFGDLEEWILQLGSYRFLLFPYPGVWLFYDPVHDTWQDTGYHIGEVRFILKDGDEAQEIRVVPQNELGPAEPAALPPPPPASTGKMSSSPTVCPSCHAELTPTATFCRKCGTNVDISSTPSKTLDADELAAELAVLPPSPPASTGEMSPTVCPSCHAVLTPEDKFCRKCGTKVNTPPPPS